MTLTRRKIISGMASASLLSIAGCSALDNNNTGPSEGETITDPSKINFPEGYNKNGVTDVDTAFGEDSTLLNTDSVEITLTLESTVPDDPTTEQDESAPQTRQITLKTDQKNKTTYMREERTNYSVERYLSDGSIYVRQTANGDSRYNVQENEYVARAEYLVQILSMSVQDVTFESVKQTGSEITYTLQSSEGLGEDNPIVKQSQGSLSQVDYELTVYDDGRIKTLKTNYSLDSEGVGVKRHLEYEKYGEVSISEPDWISEAKNYTPEQTTPNQPSGEVSWNETSEGVTVTLDSLDTGDTAQLYVDSVQFATLSVGESKTVSNGKYTGENGNVQTLTVLVPLENGSLAVLDSYTPESNSSA